jgi:hypothetical protein
MAAPVELALSGISIVILIVWTALWIIHIMAMIYGYGNLHATL